MNYSESMSKRQQRRKALNQRFRRMFLVALLMGLAMGFVFGRWKNPPNLNRCCWAVSELPPIVPVKSVVANGPRTGPTALCMVPLVWN